MRLIKLIGPAMLIAAVALFAPHTNAQTLGEYATTTAAVGNGASSLGTSIGGAVGSVSNLGSGSSTWGASSVGESFDQRTGSASGSSAGADFASRAAALSGGAGAQSRWPESGFQQSTGSNDRFGSSGNGSNDRFSTTDRFTERTGLSESSANRFPGTALDDNKMGLDNSYSPSGLDRSGSSAGLDSSGSASGVESGPVAVSGY
jgi:hypothetical protein